MKKVLALVLALACVFALCACGGQAAPAAAPAAPAEVKYKETVVFGYASDTATAEPFQDSSTQIDLVTNMTFRSMCKFDTFNGTLSPMLATEWSQNDDATVWTFKLREGVKFHDGTTLDADDIVFTFDRCVDGEQCKVPNSTLAAVYVSSKAIDPLTVEVTLNKPVYDFPYNGGTCKIFSKEAFESGIENPGYIGCGPYKWAGQEIGVSYTVEAFEDYFEGCPVTKYIQFKVMPEIDSQIAALQTGEIDFMAAARTTDQPIFDSDPNITNIFHGGSTVYFLAWNSGREIANNKLVTDAVYMAYDKEAASIAMYDGTAEITNSMVGNAVSPEFAEIENPIPYDVEGAKAKLAEAGYGEGELTITCQYYAWCKPLAEVLQACCAEIGVNVEMKEIDGSVFRALCEEGDYDITITYCGLGSSVGYMTNRFYTEAGGGNWWGYVPTEEIAAQQAVCDAQVTLETLLAESAKLQQLCAADSRYIPIFMAPLNYGMNAKLQGYADVGGTKYLDCSSFYIVEE